MNCTPTISVLMSTYNTPEKWLCAAIESILNQTFTDFEFIIVDDYSSKESQPNYSSYTDPRIKWIINEDNIGLTKSLNKALKVAKGKYIARMDADDISLPDRFKIQVEYMDKHPEVIVCGAWRRAFGSESKDEIWNIPKTREEQQVQLFFCNCGLTHPTAMFRKSMLDKYGITYNENYKKAQDYGIWVQCTRYAPMAMIPKVLLKYRKSEQQVTHNRSGVMIYDSMVKTDQLEALGMNCSEDQKKMHIKFCSKDTDIEPDKLKTWIDCIIEANMQTAYFDQAIFEYAIKRRAYDWCKKALKDGQKVEVKELYRETQCLKYIFNDCVLALKRKINCLLR